MHSSISRRGDGSAGAVAVVAIVVLVLIAGYFLFFRGGSADTQDSSVVPDTVNVNVPDSFTPEQGQ